MIAGNFKNKLAGTDERCLLSVPTSSAAENIPCIRWPREFDGTIVLFEDAPVDIRLQFES